jgi:hypothetical protein
VTTNKRTKDVSGDGPSGPVERDGRVILSYRNPDHFLTVQIIAEDHGHDLRWADGISEFTESYPALSTALARFGVLMSKIECGDEAVPPPGTSRQFADAARAFHQAALDPPPADNEHSNEHSSDYDGQKDNRALPFTLLRDAVDALTESDYPNSGFEEVIDDLRAAFDRYCALTDARATHAAAPVAD